VPPLIPLCFSSLFQVLFVKASLLDFCNFCPQEVTTPPILLARSVRYANVRAGNSVRTPSALFFASSPLLKVHFFSFANSPPHSSLAFPYELPIRILPGKFSSSCGPDFDLVPPRKGREALFALHAACRRSFFPRFLMRYRL